MSTRTRFVLAVVALLATWLLTRSIDGAEAGFIALGPAFALLLPLLSGWYIGERAIERLAAARRGRRTVRRAVVATATPRRPDTYAISGGRLLAGRLAGRAPPLPA